MTISTTIERLRSHLAATGSTQSAIAKSIGLTASVISHFLKNTYQGDVQAVADRLNEYLNLEDERIAMRIQVSKETTLKTRAYQEIHIILREISKECEMGLIVGDAGTGKTTALKAYAKANKTCILVEADHGYTARALFVDLCNTLHLETRGSIHDLLERVVTRLSESGRLIIIDEAEHLPYRALDLIRRIHDKAGVGVALVGMPRLQKNITGDRQHYAQLYSRIGAFRRIGALTDEDIEAMVRASLGTVTAEAMDSLVKACRRNARVLSKLLKWAGKLSRINGIPVNAQVVEEALGFISVAA